MTSFAITFMILLFSASASINPNPVKLSFYLLIISSLMFLLLNLETSIVWHPILYFLIFMGGILIMFMILSSILPNEKSKKSETLIPTMMILIMITNWSSSSQTYKNSISASSMKMVLNSGLTMSLMVSTMLIYFFLNLKILSKESNPMRSMLCCMEN